MKNRKDSRSRKPLLFKFFMGKIANGKGWQRMLFILGVFLVVFFVTYIIARLTIGNSESMVSTLINMLSISKIVDYGNNPSGTLRGVGLFVVYVIGLVFFSGFLIASITAWVQSFAQKFDAGLLNYKRLRGHILFLGYDDMMIGLLNSMHKKGVLDRHRVVIALEEDVSRFRQTVIPKLSYDYRNKIILLQANLTDEVELDRRLKVSRCAKVYIVGNKDMESHDSLNLLSFVSISRIANRKGEMPHCYVNFMHQSTMALFQSYSSTKTKGEAASLHDISLYEQYKRYFHPFNFDELWARKVLLNLDGRYNGFEIDMREVVDEDTGALTNKSISEVEGGFVHVVIYGMSEMAEAFAKELSFLAHYANYVKNPSCRTRITIVDEHVENPMKYFIGRYSEFFKRCRSRFVKFGDEVRVTENPIKPEDDFLDIEFEFMECNNSDIRFTKQLEEWCLDPRQYLTLVMCYEKTTRNNAAGLYLPKLLYEKRIPVFIHQRNMGSLGDFLAESFFAKVCPFGMCDDVIDLDESVEVSWAKRLNHYYRSGFKTDYSDQKIIDEQWDQTIIADRWSSIYNVTSIPFKYKNVGMHFVYGQTMPPFTPEQLTLLSEVEHNRWNAERLLMGYRPANQEELKRIVDELKNGETALKKEYKRLFINHNIVPYEELGVDEKGVPMKDYDLLLCAEYHKLINLR